MRLPCGQDREVSIPAESSKEARRLPATVGKDGHLGCHHPSVAFLKRRLRQYVTLPLPSSLPQLDYKFKKQ